MNVIVPEVCKLLNGMHLTPSGAFSWRVRALLFQWPFLKRL